MPQLDFDPNSVAIQELERILTKYGTNNDPDVLPAQTSYLQDLDRPEWIAQNLRKLRDSGVEFDTIVGTGISGIVPLLYVAKELGVNWLAVRKASEKSHTGMVAEGKLGKKWLFLDDFIDTGATLRHVKGSIDMAQSGGAFGARKFSTEFVGAYEYYKNAFRSAGDESVKRYLTTKDWGGWLSGRSA